MCYCTKIADCLDCPDDNTCLRCAINKKINKVVSP